MADHASSSGPATLRPACSALLLAAGRSKRMGADKALLTVKAVPLWRRQRDVLARSGAGEILLSVRPNQAWAGAAAGFTAIVQDSVLDFGPIAGIVAGLERASYPLLMVLAVDLPNLPSEWFGRLQRACTPAVGAVGRRGDIFEPLAAIYPRAILPLAQTAVQMGERSLQRLLARAVADGLMRVHDITPAETVWFENWNEPRLKSVDH